MGIAGPVAGQELLHRLEADLRQVERGLIAGLAEERLSEIRGQTHVLIALAGAVGASRLQQLAEAMNAAAHEGDMLPLRALAASAMKHLDQLIHFVTHQRALRHQPQ